jgi:hypothetical protein
MHAGFVPQHDFFIYVPLVQEQEGAQDHDTRNAYKTKTPFAEQILLKPGEPVLTNWTRVALPGELTVYTHACGDEEH